jgi:hypothetical protein
MLQVEASGIEEEEQEEGGGEGELHSEQETKCL